MFKYLYKIVIVKVILIVILIIQFGYCVLKTFDDNWITFHLYTPCYYLCLPSQIIDLIDDVDAKKVTIDAKYPNGTFLEEYTQVVFTKDQNTLDRIETVLLERNYTKYKLNETSTQYIKSNKDEYLVKQSNDKIQVFYTQFND